MASSSNSSPPSSSKTRLLVPRVEAKKKIQAQINKGKQLLESEIRSTQELNEFKEGYSIWNDYNKELLTRLFDSDNILKEYSGTIAAASFNVRFPPSFNDRVKEKQEDVQEKLTRLKSIYEMLELYSEPDSETEYPKKPDVVERGNRVFLVHGHNNEAKETVARFLKKLKLDVVILQEQPDEGNTIIEKFEKHSLVDYAVVLLTYDDIGAMKKTQNDPKPRARQNVILELGFFMNKLGRSNVCVLREENVEIPSDISGVLYIPLDNYGNWKSILAREIEAAGIDVDMNMV